MAEVVRAAESLRKESPLPEDRLDAGEKAEIQDEIPVPESATP